MKSKNKTVMVIEDNDLNLRLVKVLLQRGKYNVLEATDAEAGIAMASELKPDLILMDIQLPGMDGLAATRIIKDNPDLKKIPVVGFSSYAMQEDIKKATEAGCDGYITKPIDTRSFLDSISRYLKDGENGEKEKDADKEKRERKGHYRSKILIVDDEPLSVKLMAAMLPGDRYDTTKAYNGEEALDMASRICPDLILLDIMMPEIDGFEVCRRLKKDTRTSEIPVILITIMDDPSAKIKGVEAGAEDVLNKPLDPVELRARVNSMLCLKRYREQLTLRSHAAQLFREGQNQEEVAENKEDLPLVVLAENNEKEARLIQSYLEGDSCRMKLARSEHELMSLIQQSEISLILLDDQLSEMNGLEFCHRMKELKPKSNVQVLMMAHKGDFGSKINSFEFEIDDFLMKPVDSRELKARIKVLLEKKQYLDKLCFPSKTALSSTISDEFEGVHNRAYLEHFLDLEVKRSLRHKYPLALLMMAPDRLAKDGKLAEIVTSKEELQAMAKIVRGKIREVDLLARYDKKVFSVVLPYADGEDALGIAKRIQRAIYSSSSGHNVSTSMRRLGASIGISFCPSDASTVKDLIQKAERMLKKAKQKGTGHIVMSHYSFSKKK